MIRDIDFDDATPIVSQTSAWMLRRLVFSYEVFHSSESNLLHLLQSNLRRAALLAVRIPGSGCPERFHARLSEFTGTDMCLEEYVHLSVGSTLGLWKAEVCPYRTQSTRCSPEKAGFSAPVPGRWIKHVGRKDICDHSGDIV
jgi:hypothetical protein